MKLLTHLSGNSLKPTTVTRWQLFTSCSPSAKSAAWWETAIDIASRTAPTSVSEL